MSSQLPKSILSNTTATASRIPRPVGRSVGFSFGTNSDAEQGEDDSGMISNRFPSVRSPAPSGSSSSSFSLSRSIDSSASTSMENPFDRYSKTLSRLSSFQEDADFAQREYRLAREREWTTKEDEERQLSQILSARNNWMSQRYGTSVTRPSFSSSTSLSRPYTTTSLGLPNRSIISSSARSPSGYVISDGGFSYAPSSTPHRADNNSYFSSGTSLSGLGRPISLSAPATSINYSSNHNNSAWSSDRSSVISSIVSQLSETLSRSGVNISRVSLAPDGSVEMTVTRSSNANTNTNMNNDRSGFFSSLFGHSGSRNSSNSHNHSSGSGSSYDISSSSGNRSRLSSWWTG